MVSDAAALLVGLVGLFHVGFDRDDGQSDLGGLVFVGGRSALLYRDYDLDVLR